MSTLIIAEHDNKTLHPATRSTVAAAKHFTGPITVLVVGHDCQSVVAEVAATEGVNLVLSVDEAAYEHLLAEQLTSIVMSLAEKYTAILAPATTFGKNVLPRVAALLDVAQVSDVTAIVDENTFEHPIYAGNAILRVQSLDAKKVLTIRTTAFDPVQSKQPACSVEKLTISPVACRARFVSQQLSRSARPELGRASVVVSGGRGLQSAEKFKLIDDLADALGGAVGASRAAVDAGFVPNDCQVGQTGKVVAPGLYIAVGISGAIQHLAGMKDSKVIVAINKDADAPIFQISTYGLVGDLFEVVPELINALNHL